MHLSKRVPERKLYVSIQNASDLVRGGRLQRRVGRACYGYAPLISVAGTAPLLTLHTLADAIAI